jgi:hypothetical protein
MTDADLFQEAIQNLARAARKALDEGADLGASKSEAKDLEDALWKYEKLVRKMFASEIDNE